MERLVKKKGAQLLKIKMPRGGSAVGRQFGIRAVPTLWLYEGTTLVTKSVGGGSVMARLRR